MPTRRRGLGTGDLLVDPGHERQARPVSRRLPDGHHHVGDLDLVGERPPDDVVDRGMVGRLLCLDHEVRHGGTLCRSAPMSHRFGRAQAIPTIPGRRTGYCLANVTREDTTMGRTGHVRPAGLR